MEREYLVNYVTKALLIIDVKYYIVNDSTKIYVNTDQLVFDSNNMDALREFDINLYNAFSALLNSPVVISDPLVECAVTLLTQTSLSLLVKTYYNSAIPGKMEYYNTRRCFVNTGTDRTALLSKLRDVGHEGYYNFILSIWGDENPALEEIDQNVYNPSNNE